MKKTNLSTRVIKESDFLIAKEILKPDIVVKSGIKELDKLIGGFKTGKITYICGDSKLISKISNQICVNTYKTFESDALYIDAGMCTNPYKIAKYARKLELNQKEALEHIHISRAFTVYQLATLTQDMLEPAIKRYKPQTLIIGRYPILYLDNDVPKKEAKTLLRSNLHKIHELTIKYNLITILTNHDNKTLSPQKNINKILYKEADEVVLMKRKKLATYIELLKQKKNTTILHLANGQLKLQDFGMVI